MNNPWDNDGAAKPGAAASSSAYIDERETIAPGKFLVNFWQTHLKFALNFLCLAPLFL